MFVSSPYPCITRGFMDADARIAGSFLVSVHERASLAAAIANYFEKMAEQAPDRDKKRATPSLDSIRGMLRACEDQTEAYDWRRTLTALAATLGLSEDAIHETIPSSILHGLITMLPLVQTLPEDRFIVVETPLGVCSIVCWAHVVLGLSVLVRLYPDDQCVEVRFPTEHTSSEQVLVDCRARYPQMDPTGSPLTREPGISLLATTDREKLFSLQADPDDDTIDATFKVPVKGLAARVLRSSTSHVPLQDRLVQEIGLIACSFIVCIAKHLHMVRNLPNTFAVHDLRPPEDQEGNSDVEEIPEPAEYLASIQNLLDSARLLLDVPGHELDRKLIEDYATMYQGKQLYGIQAAPRSIASILEEQVPAKYWREENMHWSHLLHMAIQLSVLIVAFSCVSNLQHCGDMPVSARISVSLQSRS